MLNEELAGVENGIGLKRTTAVKIGIAGGRLYGQVGTHPRTCYEWQSVTRLAWFSITDTEYLYQPGEE
mgnify:CR=1 FL=1